MSAPAFFKRGRGVNLRIMVAGDIVGKPGRKIVTDKVPRLRRELSLDFVVVNGENAAGGSGITPDILDRLFESGVDAVTTGDHVFRRGELIPRLETDTRVLRPLNLPEASPGNGYTFVSAKDQEIAVINLVGRTFMQATRCPFLCVDRVLDDIGRRTNIIIVDMHAEATSEKVAMGWYLDGRVSAVLGTHTHIPTADARILPGGTAYMTDLGMTGPHDSVIGRRTDRVLSRFLTGLPTPFDVAKGDIRLNGAVVEVNPTSGKAISIERLEVRYE
jgi:metallophosphoesterase (TIGR00282 family)